MGLTSAQIAANQRNAQLSTGPKTPEGKAAAARNATKHGLAGAFRVLPYEDQDEFDALLAALLAQFNPEGPHESFLVEQMVQSRWKLARFERIEAAVLDQYVGIGACTDGDASIAAALIEGGGRSLATLQRYASSAQRAYYKAHAELLRSQEMRNEPKPVPTRGPKPATLTVIRSQTSPSPSIAPASKPLPPPDIAASPAPPPPQPSIPPCPEAPSRSLTPPSEC